MARLEDITVGAIVVGIAGNMPVTVVAVKWYGNAVLEVTFKDACGQLASQLLYRDDEERLDVKSDSLPWSFDADPNLLRLVSEAYRIKLAHIFDPYLAVHTSAIEPLPQTRFQRFIRKCFRVCRFAIFWQTTQARVKRL